MADMIDHFCYYIKEREAIRQKKLFGLPHPWTKDPILNRYKFTNVYREYDFTTQMLKKLYDEHSPKATPKMTLMNCATYRYFGTWEFAHALGWQTSWSTRRVIELAESRQAAKLPVFTGAYIITSGGVSGPKEQYVAGILNKLYGQAEQVTRAISMSMSWEEGYDVLHRIPGFGGTGFMCKEVLQDYLMTWHCTGDIVDRDSWTPVGPGARRGLNVIYGRPMSAPMKEEERIAECLELWPEVNRRLQVGGKKMRALTAHDIQFCLCEFAKYRKAETGMGRPRSTYRPRSIR